MNTHSASPSPNASITMIDDIAENLVHNSNIINREIKKLGELPNNFFSLSLNTKTFQETQNLLEKSDYVHDLCRIFIIDMNLSKKGGEGYDIIKYIRTHDEKNDIDQRALIIVYSGDKNAQKKAIKEGADHFFLIDIEKREEDLEKMAELIKEKLITSWMNIKIYSKVNHIDRENERVILKCKLRKDSSEYFERSQPLSQLSHINDLSIDKSILIQTYEKPGKVVITFEGSDENFFPEFDNLDNNSDLDNSPIFKTGQNPFD